jgi:hypothetical protein
VDGEVREFDPEIASPQVTARAPRVWPWARIAIAYALLEWALWAPNRGVQEIASIVFITWVIATTIAQGKNLRDLGLGVKGFGGTMIAVPFALLAAGLILVSAWMFGAVRPLYGSRPLPHALGYALWAMIQEFILNSYFFLTLEELLPRSRDAAIAAVLLFTVAHIPNPVLLGGTLLASTFFVTLFHRYRNIYPLGIAHAILGLSLALALPDAVLRHMRVGIGYCHFVIK